MTVRESDKFDRAGQGRDEPDVAGSGGKPDFTRPLSREPRLNLGWLLDIPSHAIASAILERTARAGFGDVRAAHGKVFETVAGSGSRLTDMAERALLTKQSMQYLVDDLERMGYVERLPDPADRRAKLVCVTPRGREVVHVGREAIEETEREWSARMGARKMARLRALLEELAELASERTSFGPQR